MENKHWSIVVKVLAEKGVDVSCITKDSTFVNLGLDSLDVFSIIVTLEKQYSVKFADDDIVSVKTISDALSLLAKYIP